MEPPRESGADFQEVTREVGLPLHLLMAACLAGFLPRLPLHAQGPSYQGAPIHYEALDREDPIARLSRELESGERELLWDERTGWLPALLDVIEAPRESQLLVFSKTSFQPDAISPRTPRALYFGDEVAVGWIPGAPWMELTALDPLQGPTFYTLRQTAGRPTIERSDTECLSCHASPRTRNYPGHLVRSVHPDADGTPIYRSGTFRTTDASPLEERWGGWYVTGTHGRQRHLGNATVSPGEGEERIDPAVGANVTDLSARFDSQRYLSPHSDIVALMVWEHQAEMQNVLARASYLGRHMEAQHQALGRPAEDSEAARTSRARVARLAADVVDQLLFRREIRLVDSIRGTSGFREVFEARGKRDARGRSLREFDLERRLFKYPCSYQIHSAAFDRLPDPVREAIYLELWEVLHGRPALWMPEERSFEHLSPKRRRAILEILSETKSRLPEWWQLGGE